MLETMQAGVAGRTGDRGACYQPGACGTLGTFRMDIIAIGLSHSTASIDVREQLAVRTDRLPEFLPQLKAATGLQEAVALSTCNRFEVYGATPHAGTIAPRIVRFLSYYHHLPVDQLDARLYRRAAPDSVGHLYQIGRAHV